jgi:hypothetical protein
VRREKVKKLKNLVALIASAIKWLWGYETVPLRPQDSPGLGQTHPSDRADVAAHLTGNGAGPIEVRRILAKIRRETASASSAWEAIEAHPKMKGWRDRKEAGHE